MYSRHFTLVMLLLCGSVVASATQQHTRKKKPAPVAQAPAQVPTQVNTQRPVPPQTPEHGPASPPDVTFQNGQLTIVARNSTLGDVLNSVRSRTGASVDMPPASTERVVGQFGPGAPRDVIAQLLNGSHYDYVLLGSPTDPGALKKIVLTVRATGPEPVQQAANPVPGQNPGMQAVPQVEQDQDQPSPDDAGASNDVQPEPPPQAEQEEPQGEQPPAQANPGGPTVKTPEQLLRELQQQQQQQQQQQNQPPQQ